MKAKIMMLIVGIMMSTEIVGCTTQAPQQIETKPVVTSQIAIDCKYNPAYESYIEDGKMGLVINDPTTEELKKLTKLETYKHTAGGEKILIIPKYNGMAVKIDQIEYKEDQFVVKETVYENKNTGIGYGLLLETVRPEGIPQLRVTLEGEEKKLEYLIAYNGKEGHGYIEELNVEIVKDHTASEAEQVIAARPEGDYLKGLNLINQNQIDMDNDGITEYLETYCAAEKDELGNLLMDDGQEWAVVVRKGNQIYPVFARSYVQLGKLEYKIYEEYAEKNTLHILISEVAGAGIRIFDCYYDVQDDSFKSELVYQTTGNIGVLDY